MSNHFKAFLIAVNLCCASIAGAQTSINLAKGKTAIISSQVSPYLAANAFDGDSTTRWSSVYSDPQNIYVDLGAIYPVNEVKIFWENATGKDFSIDTSIDAVHWSTVAPLIGNNSQTNDFIFTATQAQYVRMSGTARTTPYGYSIFEMEVYANPVAAPSYVYEEPICFAKNDTEERKEYNFFPPRIFVAWYCDRPGGIQGYARLWSFPNLVTVLQRNIPFGLSTDQKKLLDKTVTTRVLRTDEQALLDAFLARVRPTARVALLSGQTTRPIYLAKTDRTLGAKTKLSIDIGKPCLINDRLISWVDTAHTVPKATNYYAVTGGYALCTLTGAVTTTP